MANHHPSPTMMQIQQQPGHHQGHQAPPPPPPHPHQQAGHFPSSGHAIAAANEAVWLQIGSCSELLRVPDEAMHAYERALGANNNSIPAMNAIGMLLKGREAYDKALEYFRAITQLDQTNGEAWANLGHCYLMTENLQKAYDAYQQALVNLRDCKDPMLWYGIGILYDRYGSFEYAEEAFGQVMQFQPDFEKANEIYFRLGIIYKQQSKFAQSLDCFKYIVSSPPSPLSQDDIWFQIGHVHEQQKDFDNAKNAYNRVLENTPNHAKVLQQLGWLHHQQSNAFDVQERAIQYLEKSVGADNQDAQSWYLLGRCYMSQQKYPKAYEAYQQAVYRDGKNPTFWCSIGVLYYQINQYRDALDAYSRAIRLNPYISEVWYDLGTLYESCNNQITDALDAYQRAAELDPANPHIKARLQLLRSGSSNGGPPPAAPQPADVHPQAYQTTGPVGPVAPSWAGPAQQPPSNGPHHQQQGGAGDSWARGLSGVNPPPQPPNPYDNRGGDGFRGAVPPLQRQPTPQQDQQMRPAFPEPGRSAPPPRRGQSPGPSSHQYSQPPPSQQQQPPPSQGPALGPDARVPNPNWGGQVPSVASAPPSGHSNGVNAPNGATPFRANNSPRPDGRPPHENRIPSPKTAYPQHPPGPPYNHHSEAPPQGAPESAHPPPAPLAESHPQRTEERPGSAGPKRVREWEEESAVKKQANEENRARLEDLRHRRPSTPPRERDPYRRNSSEARRPDEPRRPEEPRNEGYHPSEAAHHSQNHSVGPQNHHPTIPQGPAPVSTPSSEKPPHAPPAPKDERAASGEQPAASRPAAPTSEPERAARDIKINDDYDDSGDDEKKTAVLANGSGPGSASGDAKTSTPTNGAVNGTPGPAPKTE
ncbi:hypothetical protein V2G26_001049 [Clonostachys chloroleuca]|uniref:General transcriptional corepressor ssn6 n=1 Tax=Clonostachys chloroleuca TaxID=1926264 RepID=A0AA35V9G4_9HYPO|nr:unnamed protein product [Clonostachys chloroleuca]